MRRWGFHQDAKAEFKETARWYETRQHGLGAEFRQEIESAISRLLAAPESFLRSKGISTSSASIAFPTG